MKQLSAKQELFCIEYIKDRNASGAYVRAGYEAKGSNGNAARMIAKDIIASRIAELVECRSAELKIDAEWVLRKASECFQICVDNGDMSTAKGYLEQVGKHVDVGAFKDRQDINVTHKSHESWLESLH